MTMLKDPETETTINQEIINLTPAAADAVRDLLVSREAEDHALRVFVQGGGCSGLQYGMALDPNTREEDTVVECHGVKVLVDEVSIKYIFGSTIDYVQDIMGSGFKVNNPNAMAACGCGNSFNTGAENTPENPPPGCSGCG